MRPIETGPHGKERIIASTIEPAWTPDRQACRQVPNIRQGIRTWGQLHGGVDK
jgi:hypothetical protein